MDTETEISKHMDTEAEIRALCNRVHHKRDRAACTMVTVHRLLPWIASTDGELRDNLVYTALYDIFEAETLQQGDLEWVLAELVSDRYL